MRGRRLFIISDLHLGGRPAGDGQPGFQICHAYGELVEFVDWVAGQGCDGEDVELVINGDIVDFLAEDDYADGAALTGWTTTDASAIDKLRLVIQRTREDRERGVFDALRDLLAAGHRLTLLLGNHDVELALPAVRRELEAVLGGDRGLLRFVHDGEAYTVGRVLIEHGNRYDPWNIIDFDRLREERSVRSRNLTIKDGFHPPSGTLLVTSFMNPLKRRYRFIDLLKPETGAVLPLLLALEPDLDLGLRALLKAFPVIRRRTRVHHDDQQMPVHRGQLGGAAASPDRPMTLDDVLRDVLSSEAALFVPPGPRPRDGQLGGGSVLAALAAKARQLRAMTSSLADLVAIKTAPSDDLRRRRLRAALAAAAAHDRTFDLAHHHGDHHVAAARTLCVRGGFDVVVFGHTHLPRVIDLTAIQQPVDRPCWYLNTGTWADVVRLDQLPQPVDDAFIDAAATNQLADYIRRYLTYAEILVVGEAAREHHLRSFCGRARPREAPLVSFAR
jgi:UDP-2,3-diacylglucosamine pyrophosphatase LpxH